MKYCSHCGTQLPDEAAFCSNCGRATGENRMSNSVDPAEASNILKLIAKIFMLLSCIAFGFALVPLCWMVPMTVYYWRSVEDNRPVSLTFKVCTLIFVNPISGILMIVEDEI